MTNLYSLAGINPKAGEFLELLARGPAGLRIERIVSHNHTTPEGQWYDQPLDEWVAVLKGRATIAYPGANPVSLGQGDCLFLPRRTRHRVAAASSPCIWLAVHGDFSE